MSEHSEAENSVKSIIWVTHLSYFEKADKNTSTSTKKQHGIVEDWIITHHIMLINKADEPGTSRKPTGKFLRN